MRLLPAFTSCEIHRSMKLNWQDNSCPTDPIQLQTRNIMEVQNNASICIDTINPNVNNWWNQADGGTPRAVDLHKHMFQNVLLPPNPGKPGAAQHLLCFIFLRPHSYMMLKGTMKRRRRFPTSGGTTTKVHNEELQTND